MQEVFNKLQAMDLLDATGAARAMALWREGQTVERAVLAADGLHADELLPALAQAYGVEYVDLDAISLDRPLLSTMPARILTAGRMLPLNRKGDRLRVAVATLFDTEPLDQLRLATGLDVTPVLADEEAIVRALRQQLGVAAETVQSLVADATEVRELDDFDTDGGDVDLAEAAQDASIIKFVNQILVDAIERRATDVHFEPFEHRLSVRFRIDGVLVDAVVPAEVRRFQAAIVSRLKILAHLDIAEKRLPQDGRIKLRVAGREVDVRVSVIPMLFGEAVVLRLLDRSATLSGLTGLGMDDDDLALFEQSLSLPHGIVLVTGPTGSGKTTSLYAALAKINDVSRKIITIEDPVEYHLEGVNQIQVDTRTGLTFARGLRSILRHDPDVVLVGEIRDRETGEIAVQASLTGHLVFSTLHTNDAPGAVTRLVDMGIEPYLVSSSLEMVVAQRLVRLICENCRTPVPPSEQDRIRARWGDAAPDRLTHGVGCEQCGGSGYRGRNGIFEIMPITPEVRRLAMEQVSSQAIRTAAVSEGMRSLRESGWRLVMDGRTTIEEVLRVTRDSANGVAATREG